MLKDAEFNKINEDNIIRTKPRKKGYFKYILLLLIICISALVAYKYLGTPSVEIEINAKVEFDTSSKYDFINFENNVISCNKNGIFAYNKNGKIKWSHNISFANPKCKVVGNKIIVTDLFNKNSFAFDKNGKLINSVNYGAECVSASINNNGWITAILKNKGYKAQVAVYSNDGELKFSWNSANNNVVSAELSENNKTLAVAQIDTVSSAEANGVISLFDISTDGKPYCGKNTGSNIVSYIRWNGNKLLCTGSTNAFCIDNSGSEIWNYKYPGETSFYNMKSDKYYGFAISETSTSAVKKTLLYIVDYTGKEKGVAEIDGDIKNIDISGNNIAVASSNKIIFLKPDGRVKKEIILSRDISRGVIFDDFDSVFIVSGTSTEIISLK